MKHDEKKKSILSIVRTDMDTRRIPDSALARTRAEQYELALASVSTHHGRECGAYRAIEKLLADAKWEIRMDELTKNTVSGQPADYGYGEGRYMGD